MPLSRRSILGLALTAVVATAVATVALPRGSVAEPVAPVFAEDGIAIRGTDPVAYFTEGRAVQGDAAIHADWMGARWQFASEEHRKLFLSDPETAFTKFGLTDEEKDLVRRRDWRAMIHYGVIFFMLEKLGAVVGTTNLHIYSAMKGMTLEDFQKTRNAQVLYSVAGKDAGKTDWDKAQSK